MALAQQRRRLHRRAPALLLHAAGDESEHDRVVVNSKFTPAFRERPRIDRHGVGDLAEGREVERRAPEDIEIAVGQIDPAADPAQHAKQQRVDVQIVALMRAVHCDDIGKIVERMSVLEKQIVDIDDVAMHESGAHAAEKGLGPGDLGFRRIENGNAGVQEREDLLVDVDQVVAQHGYAIAGGDKLVGEVDGEQFAAAEHEAEAAHHPMLALSLGRRAQTGQRGEYVAARRRHAEVAPGMGKAVNESVAGPGRNRPIPIEALQYLLVLGVIIELVEVAGRCVPAVLAKIGHRIRVECNAAAGGDLDVKIPVAADPVTPRFVPNGLVQWLFAHDAAADVGDHVVAAEGAAEPFAGVAGDGSRPYAGLGVLAITVETGVHAALDVAELDFPEGDHHGPIGEIGNQMRQRVRLAQIVAFANPDQLAVGKRDTALPLREHIAGVLFVVDLLDRKRRARGHLVEDVETRVGRGVVEQNQLDAAIGLTKDRLEPLAQKGRVVVVRHDDRNQRRVLRQALGEIRRRGPLLVPTVADIVQERVDARCRQLRIAAKVEVGRKLRRRVETLFPAKRHVVVQRIERRIAQVRVLVEIIVFVEVVGDRFEVAFAETDGGEIRRRFHERLARDGRRRRRRGGCGGRRRQRLFDRGPIAVIDAKFDADGAQSARVARRILGRVEP